MREDPLVHPYKWLRPDLVPPALFCSVTLSLLLVVLGFWLIRAGSMRNSEKLGFPTSAALGKGRPALRNSLVRLKGGYHSCRRFPCHGLLERCLLMLFDVRALLLVAWTVGVGGSSRLSRFPGLRSCSYFIQGGGYWGLARGSA